MNFSFPNIEPAPKNTSKFSGTMEFILKISLHIIYLMTSLENIPKISASFYRKGPLYCWYLCAFVWLDKRDLEIVADDVLIAKVKPPAARVSAVTGLCEQCRLKAGFPSIVPIV